MIIDWEENLHFDIEKDAHMKFNFFEEYAKGNDLELLIILK